MVITETIVDPPTEAPSRSVIPAGQVGHVETVLTDLLGVPDVCGILESGGLVFIDRDELANTETLKILDHDGTRIVALHGCGRPVQLQSTRATSFDRSRNLLFLIEELGEFVDVGPGVPCAVKCIRLDDGEVRTLLTDIPDVRALAVAPELLFLMDRSQIQVVEMRQVDQVFQRRQPPPNSASSPDEENAVLSEEADIRLAGLFHAGCVETRDAGNFSTMVFGPDNALYVVDTTAQRSLCRFDIDRQRFDIIARVPCDRSPLWGPDFSSSLSIDSDRNLYYTHMGTEVTSCQWVSVVDVGALLKTTVLATRPQKPGKHHLKKLPSRLPVDADAFRHVAEVASPRFFLLDDDRGLLYVASCRWVPGVHDMICEIISVKVPSKMDRYLEKIMPLLLTFHAVGRGTAELKQRKWTRQTPKNEIRSYNALNFLAKRFAITRYLLSTILEFAYLPRPPDADGLPLTSFLVDDDPAAKGNKNPS